MIPPPPRLFCFGLGYSALALADKLKGDGWRIAGTCRGADTAAALAAQDIDAYPFERDRPLADPEAALAGTTHLLASIPPDGSGDPVVDRHGDAIGALTGLAWAGYLSTTGVYGDHGGGWVDEETPLTPSGPRGERRLAAERAWLGLLDRFGTPVHLFRLAGIYGPGRNALVTVKAGRAHRIVKPGQVFSRIHRDDIVETLLASMRQAQSRRRLQSLRRRGRAAAGRDRVRLRPAGRDPPPEVPYDEAALSPMARSFYADNKRVRNDRIKTELGVTLRWPTYREGLRALLAVDG